MNAELQAFIIDICEATQDLDDSDFYDEHGYYRPTVRMKSYQVLGSSAEEALSRFLNDENAGVEVYSGDPVGMIIVGLSPA